MPRLVASSLIALGTLSGGVAAEPERGTVSAADGVPIVWESRGSGEPALVLVHCWACDREFFREQVGDLSTDHRVVTLDLPGHGESGAQRERWSVTGLGADVASKTSTPGRCSPAPASRCGRSTPRPCRR
jgi:pimeloyl-ACP methyl ester carboxylesterase